MSPLADNEVRLTREEHEQCATKRVTYSRTDYLETEICPSQKNQNVILNWLTSRYFFLFLISLGALLRVCVLPKTGTEDHGVFMLWSYVGATHSVSDIYPIVGASKAPLCLQSFIDICTLKIQPMVANHNNIECFVDYPPLIPWLLGLAGKIYSLYSPTLENSKLFEAIVKLPEIISECLICFIIFEHVNKANGTRIARLASLSYWLNPVVILTGPFYAYQDSLCMLWIVLAVLAAVYKNFSKSAMFCAVAFMTKPQAVIVFPALFAASVLLKNHSKTYRHMLAFFGVLSCFFIPFLMDGTLVNLCANNWRNAIEPFLSGQCCNPWWLINYADQIHESLTRTFDVSSALRVQPTIGTNSPLNSDGSLAVATIISIALYSVWITFVLYRWWRYVSTLNSQDKRVWLLPECCALLMFGQCMILLHAHENHGYGAAVLLLGTWTLNQKFIDWKLLLIGWCWSILVSLNLINFYGLGPLLRSTNLHNLLWLDFSVVLSIANTIFGVYWIKRWIQITRITPHKFRSNATASIMS